MRSISKEIKIALLGIIAIALFFFVYNFLKGSSLFSSTQTIKVEYDHVQGLTPSSVVQIQGLTIGAVSMIEMSKEHPGKVVVSIHVDKDILIPNDTKASIISLDLLGTKAINLRMGSSTAMVQNNQYIGGEVILGTIESLSASAIPAIENAKLTLASLDQTVHSINNILDIETQNNLKATVADMSKTMKDFGQFANELNAQRNKISSLLTNLNAFSSSLDKNANTITSVLNNTQEATAKMKNIDFEGTVTELKSTMDDLQTTLYKMNEGNGSMALLMNDDKLYRNLKNTLATANNLLADINARPSRYINVAIFGKKNKNDGPPQPAPNAND